MHLQIAVRTIVIVWPSLQTIREIIVKIGHEEYET
jgi:hypothetical protein